MYTDISLEKERKQAIKIALDFHYKDTVEKLKEAKSVIEIGRIMATARKNKNWEI